MDGSDVVVLLALVIMAAIVVLVMWGQRAVDRERVDATSHLIDSTCEALTTAIRAAVESITSPVPIDPPKPGEAPRLSVSDGAAYEDDDSVELDTSDPTDVLLPPSHTAAASGADTGIPEWQWDALVADQPQTSAARWAAVGSDVDEVADLKWPSPLEAMQERDGG